MLGSKTGSTITRPRPRPTNAAGTTAGTAEHLGAARTELPAADIAQTLFAPSADTQVPRYLRTYTKMLS